MRIKNGTLAILVILFSCTQITNNDPNEKKIKVNYLAQKEFDKVIKDRNRVRLSRKDSDFLIAKYKGNKEIEIPDFKLSEKTIRNDFDTKGSWVSTSNGYRCYCYHNWETGKDVFDCPESPCEPRDDGTGNGDNGNGDGGNGNNEDPNKELELAVSKTVFSTVIPDQSINLDVKAKSNETWNVGLKITGSSWLGEGKGDKSFSANTIDFGSPISDGNYYFELSSLLRSNTIKKDVIVDNTKPIFSEPIIDKNLKSIKFKINAKDIEKNRVMSGLDITKTETNMIIPDMTVSNIKVTELSDKSIDITADIINTDNTNTTIHNFKDKLDGGSYKIKVYDKAGNFTEYTNNSKKCTKDSNKAEKELSDIKYSINKLSDEITSLESSISVFSNEHEISSTYNKVENIKARIENKISEYNNLYTKWTNELNKLGTECSILKREYFFEMGSVSVVSNATDQDSKETFAYSPTGQVAYTESSFHTASIKNKNFSIKATAEAEAVELVLELIKAPFSISPQFLGGLIAFDLYSRYLQYFSSTGTNENPNAYYDLKQKLSTATIFDTVTDEKEFIKLNVFVNLKVKESGLNENEKLEAESMLNLIRSRYEIHIYRLENGKRKELVRKLLKADLDSKKQIISASWDGYSESDENGQYYGSMVGSGEYEFAVVNNPSSNVILTNNNINNGHVTVINDATDKRSHKFPGAAECEESELFYLNGLTKYLIKKVLNPAHHIIAIESSSVNSTTRDLIKSIKNCFKIDDFNDNGICLEQGFHSSLHTKERYYKPIDKAIEEIIDKVDKDLSLIHI